MNLTLRIKKVYFDRILNGDKFIEYRDKKPFYNRILRNKDQFKTLILHYQKPCRLKCEITAVKIISLKEAKKITPKEFVGDIHFAPDLYAIHFRNPKLFKKE